jgi:hypothetical protein
MTELGQRGFSVARWFKSERVVGLRFLLVWSSLVELNLAAFFFIFNFIY